MSRPTLIEVQDRFYQRLSLDSTFMSAVGNRFYNYVPQDTLTLPYAKYFIVAQNLTGEKGELGFEALIQLSVFSEERGTEFLSRMFDNVFFLFQYKPLAMSGGQNYLMNLNNSQTITETDGVTQHLVMEWRVTCGNG